MFVTVVLVQLRQGRNDIFNLHRLDQDEDAGRPWGSLVTCTGKKSITYCVKATD